MGTNAPTITEIYNAEGKQMGIEITEKEKEQVDIKILDADRYEKDGKDNAYLMGVKCENCNAIYKAAVRIGISVEDALLDSKLECPCCKTFHLRPWLLGR